ncbi:hypothetical protein [Listeria monocytogenes]
MDEFVAHTVLKNDANFDVLKKKWLEEDSFSLASFTEKSDK